MAKKRPFNPRSHIDPSRETVGKIYRDTQINCDKSPIPIGDVVKEMTKSLVDDINQGIKEGCELFDKPFYVTIIEKKDLQMKNAIVRTIRKTPFRPWPEDDTTTFKHDPKTGETLFCWCLPHFTDMPNTLANYNFYCEEYIADIRAFRNFDLDHFGFVKDSSGNWMANPIHKDRPLKHGASKHSLSSGLISVPYIPL